MAVAAATATVVAVALYIVSLLYTIAAIIIRIYHWRDWNVFSEQNKNMNFKQRK